MPHSKYLMHRVWRGPLDFAFISVSFSLETKFVSFKLKGRKNLLHPAVLKVTPDLKVITESEKTRIARG
jgi:hypothetical protein